MPLRVEIKVPYQKIDDQLWLNHQINLSLKIKEFNSYIIKKKSLDARSVNIFYILQIEVFLKDEQPDIHFWKPHIAKLKPILPVAIIGMGPAGIFAALTLLELGIKPIIFERGKDVKARRRSLAILNKEGIVDDDSNYCFGEGGAGTFSDGKLYTRSNKRGFVNKVYEIFVHHGAKDSILYDAHPHIGTNKLPQIIENLRNTIINAGGEIHFEHKLSNIIIENNSIKYLEINHQKFDAFSNVILATGHSARDIFNILDRQKIHIECKPFALGVRIEHPQALIDQSRYRMSERPIQLPPSSYALVTQVAQKGVFSFCMCPGGIIASAATSQNEIVVNGWSPSKRNGKFANSGLVTSVDDDDFKILNHTGALRGLHYQQMVEQKANAYGGGLQKAPAQRLLDFLNNKISNNLPEHSYIPGLNSCNLNEILPSAIAQRIKKAIPEFGKKIKGYDSNEAIVVAVESRTSSPVKIPRHSETLEHIQIKSLYPCGEGAGYAGGIVSAALDGINVAHAIAQKYENN